MYPANLSRKLKTTLFLKFLWRRWPDILGTLPISSAPHHTYERHQSSRTPVWLPYNEETLKIGLFAKRGLLAQKRPQTARKHSWNPAGVETSNQEAPGC